MKYLDIRLSRNITQYAAEHLENFCE